MRRAPPAAAPLVPVSPAVHCAPFVGVAVTFHLHGFCVCGVQQFFGIDSLVFIVWLLREFAVAHSVWEKKGLAKERVKKNGWERTSKKR